MYSMRLHTRGDQATFLLLQACSSCVVIQQTTQRCTRDLRYALPRWWSRITEKKNTYSWNIYVAFHKWHESHDTGMNAAAYGPQILKPMYRLSCLRNRRPCNTTTSNHPYHSYHDHICQRSNNWTDIIYSMHSFSHTRWRNLTAASHWFLCRDWTNNSAIMYTMGREHALH